MSTYLRGVLFVLIGALATAVVSGQTAPRKLEPQWQPALAEGGAPDCPEHQGQRSYRSDIVRDAHTVAFVTGMTVRSGNGCQSTASIRVSQSGGSRTFPIAVLDKQNLYIVDFSPDGSG